MKRKSNLKNYYFFMESERLQAKESLKAMKKRDKGNVSVYINDRKHTIYRVKKKMLKQKLKEYEERGLDVLKVL